VSSIALVRVDDRLIHGQVVVKWLRQLDCREIWIVDDKLSVDSFMQSILRLAAPTDVRVFVVPLSEGAVSLGLVPAGRNALVLVKSPQTALALLDCGLDFRELNVGALAGGAGTVRLYRSISASDDQIRCLREIADRGVRVFFQTVPEERPVDLGDVLPIVSLPHSGAAVRTF
jgi:D-glucosaminate-specific PTS system IIB component